MSLVESILDKKAEIPPAVSQQGLKAYSIRTDRWKLYGTKLYDLESDPEEKEDVSRDNNDLTRTLTEMLDEVLKSRTAATGTQAKPDKVTLEQLKALGYAE